MRSELKSKKYPTVFSSNAIAFEEWKSAGYAEGVDEISNPELKALYESVPDALKLQFEGEGNYGIPYNIEGYGLIADRQMLEDILGTTDLDAFIADYKEADYEEFQQMVTALNDYINDGRSESFTLNGSSYKTQSDKNRSYRESEQSLFPSQVQRNGHTEIISETIRSVPYMRMFTMYVNPPGQSRSDEILHREILRGTGFPFQLCSRTGRGNKERITVRQFYRDRL